MMFWFTLIAVLGSIFFIFHRGLKAIKGGPLLITLTLFGALSFYVFWGDWQGVQALQSYETIQATLEELHATNDLNQTKVSKALNSLEKNISSHPKVKVRMGDIYQRLGWAEQAQARYAEALMMNPTDFALKMKYLYALSLANGGRLEESDKSLLMGVLHEQPFHVPALNLLATDAFQRGEYALAKGIWEDMLPRIAPGAFEEKNAVVEAIQQAESKLNGKLGPLSVSLEVHVDAQSWLKSELPLDTSVFIFAKMSDQKGPPLAVIKKRLKDLPCKVLLDQRHQMAKGYALAPKQSVIVGARIARNDTPLPQKGDFEGTSSVLVLEKHHAVDVHIHKEI